MDYGVGLGVDMGEQILFCLCECNNGQVKFSTDFCGREIQQCRRWKWRCFRAFEIFADFCSLVLYYSVGEVWK